MIVIETGIFPNTPEEQYFGLNDGIQRGDPNWIISRSELHQILRCPKEWRLGAQEKDTESLTLGSLVDCLLLTPDEFEKRFVTRPETYQGKASAKKDAPMVEKKWSANATFCKEWEAKMRDKGISVVTPGMMAKAKRMVENFGRHYCQDFEGFLGSFLEGADTQTMVISKFKVAGREIFVRCLIDIRHRSADFGNFLWDLKTAADLEPTKWQRAIIDHGYDIQGPFYLDLYNREEKAPEPVENFGHLIVGNQYPFLTGTRYLSGRFLDVGRLKYKRALKIYADCLGNDWFPGWSPDGLEATECPTWEYRKFEEEL